MRRLLSLVFGLFLMFPAVSALGAEEVVVTEIVERSSEYAGQEVTVEGELVGDYGFRSDGWMWTQLNGDVYVSDPITEGGDPSGSNVGIGVRIPSVLADGLDHPGGYHHRGPVVRLTGIWRYHDPGFHGETFLDVASLDVIEPGRQLDEPVVWWTIIAGSILLFVSGALWFFRPRVTEV